MDVLLRTPLPRLSILSRQGGAGEQATANHESGKARIARLYIVQLLQTGEVAIIDERMTALLVECGKGLVVNVSLVLLHSSAWVQGDVGEGRIVENLQDGLPLLGIVPSEAHLHGEGQVGVLLDGIGHLFNNVSVCQESRPTTMFGLQGKGAPHIEVYLAVA